MSPAITVRPVRSRRDLKAFIRLPERLRKNDPYWVPPLRFERKHHLDRKSNPWFKHAEAEYFLAERDGEVVGRITAQVDFRWDEFRGGKDGMFGFFESENDVAVAQALIDAARGWLAERGRDKIIGPMNFSTNDECGVLVAGFDDPPVVLQPWNPPYYDDILKAVGLVKEMDMNMWALELGGLSGGDGMDFGPLIEKAAEKSEENGVVIRGMRRSEMQLEIDRFMDVYNEAWEKNWGFVPITAEEVAYQAKNLKPLLDENWAMIAELDGEVVGAALTLPDFNQIFIKMKGKLLPFGWWHIVFGKKKITRVRVFALGVKKPFRHLGVGAAFYVRHRETAARTPQKHGETGWILENNRPMNNAAAAMGAEIVKTYRLYSSGV